MQQPIFLTGSHRSGTTWVGKIISTSKSVGYILEPFNLLFPRPGVVDLNFGRWFQYISDDNGPAYFEQIRRMLEFQYNLRAGLCAIRSAREVAKFVRDYYLFNKYRMSHVRPCVKEPDGIFMAPWFSETFHSDIIVLIRHPAAFVSSLLVLRWDHPFSEFLEQPTLMRDYLYPFQEELADHARVYRDPIDQAILLWKIIHHTILLYKQKYKDWIYIRHEDLSSQPAIVFENLFKALQLRFDDSVKKAIARYSSEANPADTTSEHLDLQSTKAIRRNSKANIYNWKNRLTAEQIEHIRVCVEGISEHFYDAHDW